MFSLRKCTESFIRTYRKGGTNNLNPGINRRLKVLQEEQPEWAKGMIDEESLENLELDVKNSKNLHNLHQREISKIQKKILFKQLERKYFPKEKLPNMLLWVEKEQIRLLNQTDPDFWTPEKLSASFPATPEIIAKIIKSQWKPTDDSRIKTHDAAVVSNWQAFEAGNLSLPDHHANHLKLFTTRREVTFQVTEPEEKSVVKLEQNQEGGEFSSIIKDYKQRSSAKNHEEKEQSIPLTNSIENNSFVFGYNQRNRRSFRRERELTLADLKQVMDLKADRPTDHHQLLVSTDDQDTSTNLAALNEVHMYKNNNNDQTGVTEIPSTHGGASYPKLKEEILMKIEIPKEKWKKGCTYKFNNCYYSDDGEFLYRV